MSLDLSSVSFHFLFTILILEGARFDIQSGTLEESKPKEMFCPLPVCYCKALQVQETGSLREDKTIYQCPCYKIEDRKGTFVFTG